MLGFLVAVPVIDSLRAISGLPLPSAPTQPELSLALAPSLLLSTPAFAVSQLAAGRGLRASPPVVPDVLSMAASRRRSDAVVKQPLSKVSADHAVSQQPGACNAQCCTLWLRGTPLPDLMWVYLLQGSCSTQCKQQIHA